MSSRPESDVQRSRPVIQPFDLACVRAGTGCSIDKALTLLEQIVASHNLVALFIKVERFSSQVRSHPRFQRLLKTVGFP